MAYDFFMNQLFIKKTTLIEGEGWINLGEKIV